MDFQGSRFQDDDGALRRRAADPAIEILVHKVSKMEMSMDKMADAVTKLAVVEERQTAHHAALERAFASIAGINDKFDRLIGRIEKLEGAAPLNSQTQKWVERALWAAAAAAAMYVAKKVGFIT
jgi:hypothetical protein